MPRYAYVVVALPDDAPTDAQALAEQLCVSWFASATADHGDEIEAIVYTGLAGVLRDRLAGNVCRVGGDRLAVAL